MHLALKDEGFSLVATSLEESKNFFDEDLVGKVILSVGNEGGKGKIEEYLSQYMDNIKIYEMRNELFSQLTSTENTLYCT